MKLFGRNFDKASLLKYVGDISQLGGIEMSELSEGSSKGVRNIRIKTAAGLDFSVNPDCGMNISNCSFKGIPLAWRSGTGISHPGLYDPQLNGWLRSFDGGLLATCGLSQIGAPSVDEGYAHGLHGRIANTPGEINVAKGEWVDGKYRLNVEGTLRESLALGQRLVLRRKITTYLDSSEIEIKDTITNESWYEAPLLISYHINFGFPLISETTKLVFEGHKSSAPYNEEALKRGVANLNQVSAPLEGFQEEIFTEELTARNGYKTVTVENKVEEEIISAQVSYSDNLKNLIHWRQFGWGDYVLGLEPANTLIGGRVIEMEKDNVLVLKPRESVEYTILFKFVKENE